MTPSRNKTAKDKQKRIRTPQNEMNKRNKRIINKRELMFCESRSFLSAVLLAMLNFEQRRSIGVRAVAALVAGPLGKGQPMQAHIEHRHPTDVSSCSFQKALFLSMARQAFVLLWKSS